jgi:hypothetical protein
MFQTKAPEVFGGLSRHLHFKDLRVAVAAATQILDCAYGRPSQHIDANINEEGSVPYCAEVPRKAASTEEWLESISRKNAGRALVTVMAAAVDHEKMREAESVLPPLPRPFSSDGVHGAE